MMNFSLLAQQAAQRARGYWLLSRLFLEVPSVPMLMEVRHALGDEHGLDGLELVRSEGG